MSTLHFQNNGISSPCTLCSCWQGFWRCQSRRSWRSSDACQEEYSESSGPCAGWVCCGHDTRQVRSAQRSGGSCPRPAESCSASVCNQPKSHLHEENNKKIIHHKHDLCSLKIYWLGDWLGYWVEWKAVRGGNQSQEEIDLSGFSNTAGAFVAHVKCWCRHKKERGSTKESLIPINTYLSFYLVPWSIFITLKSKTYIK